MKPPADPPSAVALQRAIDAIETRSKPRRASMTPPPQRPPGDVPSALTLDQVYADGSWPDEDEALWGNGPPTDRPFKVVRIDPVEVVRTWRSWNGSVLQGLRPANREVFTAYRADVRKGTWLGYLVFQSAAWSGDPSPTLLDGYHRMAAMAREGVREAYAVDLSEPE